MFTCNGKTYAITTPYVKHKQGDFKADYTVVGSPTITNDGEVSGFSTSNYLSLPETFTPVSGDTWEIGFEVTTGSNVTTHQTVLGCTPPNCGGMWLALGRNSTAKFDFSAGSGTSFTSDWNIASHVVGSTAITANTTYYIKIIFTGSEYKVLISTNNLDWITDISITSSVVPSAYTNKIGICLIGNSTYAHPWLGSIDLTQSYIKINNEFWWSGFYTEDVSGYKNYLFTKKGIIHTAGEFKRDFNVIGSPTISNNGIVNGFSTSNYIQLPNVFRPGSSPWERVICFTTGNDVSSVQMINFINPVEDFSKAGGGILVIYQGKIYMSLSSTNTAWNIVNDNAGKTTLSPNTTYYVKLKFTGTEYQKILSTTGEFNGEETLENTVVSSTPIYQANTLGDRFGYRMAALTQVFGGSIDLSQSYIKINDEYWWSGIYRNDVYGDKYY